MKNSKLSFSLSKINDFLIFLFILFLPTQLGKHFFFDFSYIDGVRIDYLSLVFYFIDFLTILVFLTNFKIIVAFIKSHLKIILFFLIFFLKNISISVYPLLSIYHLIKIFQMVFIFVIFKNLKISRKLIYTAFFSGGLFEIFLALLQFVKHSSLQGIFYFFGERRLFLSGGAVAKASLNGAEFLRPYGTFSHPNSLAGFYLLLYFYFLLSQPRGSNIWILLKYFSLLIFSFLIFISFSKAAIIIFFVLNIYYIIRFFPSRCHLCKIARIFSTGISSLVFLLVKTDPTSLVKRVALFEHSLKILESHLLWGVGLGHYLYFESKFTNPYAFFFVEPVHNIFLLFVSETGIILAGLIFYILLRHFKSTLKNTSFNICFLVILATGMIDHYWLTLQQNWLLMPVVLALLTNQKLVKLKQAV